MGTSELDNTGALSFSTNFEQILEDEINGLVQDWSNSIALAMELLQSCTEPMLWRF